MFRDIINALIKFLPRPVTVYPDERGLLFRCGKFKKTLLEGLYIALPVIDDIQKITTVTQTRDLRSQSLTVGGKEIAISGYLEFSIENAYKAWVNVEEYQESVYNLALATTIKGLVKNPDLNIENIEAEVFDQLDQKTAKWGIAVSDFQITDLCEHKVYRILNNQSIIPVEEE